MRAHSLCSLLSMSMLAHYVHCLLTLPLACLLCPSFVYYAYRSLTLCWQFQGDRPVSQYPRARPLTRTAQGLNNWPWPAMLMTSTLPVTCWPTAGQVVVKATREAHARFGHAHLVMTAWRWRVQWPTATTTTSSVATPINSTWTVSRREFYGWPNFKTFSVWRNVFVLTQELDIQTT